MAIVQNPITGRTRKKFGNAVFSEQFGKNTMRTKPVKVKNPRTVGQVNQRSKFSIMVAESRKLLALLKVSFKSMTMSMSAFNAFIKSNIKTAITGSHGNYSISYPDLVIAKGPLPQISTFSSSVELSGAIKRQWTPPIDPNDPANNDLLYVATYSTTAKQWFFGLTTTTRLDGTHSQTLPGTWTAGPVHTYSFFVNAASTSNTDSVYNGSVTL